MGRIEWTILTEESFDSEIAAYKFINMLKLQTLAHYGKIPNPCDDCLEFKVSKRSGKYYISYKLR